MTADDPRHKKRAWAAKYIPRPSSKSSDSGSARGPFALGRQTSSSAGSPGGEELTVISPCPTSPAALSRASTRTDSPPVSRPSTPKRWPLLLTPSTSPKLYPQELDQQASQVILNALEYTNSQQPPKPPSRGSFSRMSFSSMMGGLSSLSLTRTITKESTTDKPNGNGEEKESRGRSLLRGGKRPKSASQAPTSTERDASPRSRSRARSQSPFLFHRIRQREQSPAPQPVPLAQSDGELSDTSAVHPRSTSFTDEAESGDELAQETDAETEDEPDSEENFFDVVTERNTEKNAQILLDVTGIPEVEEPDPLGEGVNVVVPHEPYFPSTLNTGAESTRGKKGVKRRKTLKHEPLPMRTSRPLFERDRCTTTITQGDPQSKLAGRISRRYMVAIDLGEESRYALEWGIGTVLRDGDELLVVHIIENESKVDPPIPNATDRAQKLRSQQERQGFAYILVRQATSLLQRTKLNVKLVCQAWHAKNARHMLLDIADYYEPTMLIVGSRGLGQLSGILLGSTSHYLIQKCSVPVMVARRRLKRPPKKSAHLVKNRAHVSLAEAAIDRVAAKVDMDVKTIRDEMQRAEEERKQERSSGKPTILRNAQRINEGEGDIDDADDAEDESDEASQEIKVV